MFPLISQRYKKRQPNKPEKIKQYYTISINHKYNFKHNFEKTIFKKKNRRAILTTTCT